MSKIPSQSDLILAHFKKYPMQELHHEDWIDEVTKQVQELTGKIPRDLWRATRKLHADGKLKKIRKGVYMYDPDYVHNPELEDFTEEQKQKILERDAYQCVVCGRGKKDGVEIQVDHIKPKSKGGKATIENGQTLCGEHNYRKKNYNQTETGKKMFIRLYELAKTEGDTKLLEFIEDVMDVYEKHGINGHIVWDDDEQE
ncbi:MAG: HNH endonuclease signature motif containing protein [Chloroflexota bacterium]